MDRGLFFGGTGIIFFCKMLIVKRVIKKEVYDVCFLEKNLPNIFNPLVYPGYHFWLRDKAGNNHHQGEL